MKTKQVIVVNRALNMPPGKLAAQVAHASMGALLSTTTRNIDTIFIDLSIGSAREDWLDGIFTKIVVYVKSEAKLIDIYQKAKERKLPCFLVEDCGATFFDKPTITCVGIGPAWNDEFIGITDKLQLLE
jgi:peptidyl-tRNA hydrolase